mmetsp:Transcript_18215/g.59860  ORF Transcript_18215/g.59860 Transcript_18215/m.59860 type:complete len:166 (-) Transcript_18215:186-683(-)
MEREGEEGAVSGRHMRAHERMCQDVGDFVRYIGLEQYRAAFEENFINGKRLLRMTSNTLPQLGIQRFDHIKYVWKHIKKIQKLVDEYEQTLSDPDRKINASATRIQSLARGKLERKRLEDMKQKQQEKEYAMFQQYQKEAVEAQSQAAILIQKSRLAHLFAPSKG